MQPTDHSEGLFATITTAKGAIKLKLEYQKVPMTVASFVALAEGKMRNTAKPEGTPYYDGIKFHRVIAIQMRGRPVGDEKLASVRIRASVRHAQRARSVMLE